MLHLNRWKLAAAVASLVAPLVAQQAVDASTAYALVTNPPSPSGNSRLYTFDTAVPSNFTLKGESLAVNGNQFPSGLDFDGAGNLYATTNLASNFLTTINPNTGAFSNARGSGLTAGFTISDLSWDRLNNRMLGLATNGVAGTAPQLYNINTTTGAASFLGALTGGPFDGVDVSLAVRADGLIFMHGVATDRWYTVNPTTLATTPLGTEGFDSNFGQGGTFDHTTNTLYHAGFNGATFNGELWTVNQATGLGTFLGTMGTNVATSAVQVTDMAFAPIPEPASLTIISLSGLMLVRRRK